MNSTYCHTVDSFIFKYIKYLAFKNRSKHGAARPLAVGGSVWLGTIKNYARFAEYQTTCMISDVRLILK